MRKYMMIAIGGFFGAVLRFSLKSIELPIKSYGLPINTLLINLLGCFVLGIFVVLASELFKLEEAEKLGIITGFIGAFTTFSTISKEIGVLISAGMFYIAITYIFLSVVMGLGAVYFGFWTGNIIIVAKAEKE